MKKYTIAATLALCAVSLAAQTAQEYLMLGNSAYKKGDYAAAAEHYRSAIGRGGNSAELYFNAATACAKTGKKGEATLNYLRANMQNPRLREADANLKIFAKDNDIALPARNAAQMYLFELSSFEWSAVAICAFWGAAILLILPLLYGKRNAAYMFAALVSAIIAAVAVYALCLWDAVASTAVALADDVELRLAPTPNAPIVARVHEGALAKVSAQKDGFALVQTRQANKRGWADIKKFAPVGK